MRTFEWFRILWVAGLVALFAGPVAANIYLDENFEDATPFSDLNWPIQDNVTPPDALQIQANQGANVRSIDGAAGNTAPKVVMTTDGAISTAESYSGSQSLQLASGQSMAVSGNAAYCNAALNWLIVMQFAVTVDAATLTLPSGTQVGYFRQNWSTDGSDGLGTVEAVYQLNFVRNAAGGVDIIVDTNSTKVGEIIAEGKWVVVSVIADKNPDPLGTPWEAWDPITSTYKGPQPTGDPFNATGTYDVLDQGIYVFANSNTAGNHITAAEVGGGWCTAETGPNDTFLLNWEIAAENAGTVFVDECCWSHGLHQGGKAVDPITQESSARLTAFQPPEAAASTWTLYSQ